MLYNSWDHANCWLESKLNYNVYVNDKYLKFGTDCRKGYTEWSPQRLAGQ